MIAETEARNRVRQEAFRAGWRLPLTKEASEVWGAVGPASICGCLVLVSLME
jgi:hypothetical protein